MNITQMKCFVALYNLKSFTKAAEILYMSQPAISKNISALEEEVGAILVERKKGGKVQITRSGEAYFNFFNTTLKNLEETDFRVKYLLSDTKHVYRVGILESWYMPKFIELCNSELPEDLKDIEFVFDFASPLTINSSISNGSLDFAFTLQSAFEPTKNYSKKPVADIHSSLYTHKDNPAVENGTINTEKLDPILYTIESKQFLYTYLDTYSEIFSHTKLIVKEVSSGHSAFMNVISGVGSAISDEWSFDRCSSFTVAKTIDEINLTVIFVRKTEGDSEYNKVSDFLLSIFKKWAAKYHDHN